MRNIKNKEKENIHFLYIFLAQNSDLEIFKVYYSALKKSLKFSPPFLSRLFVFTPFYIFNASPRVRGATGRGEGGAGCATGAQGHIPTLA